MYVVHVIPITRAAFKEQLSFFSKAPLLEGSIVDVPIRGKVTPALVVESKEVREEKLSLRGSAYALKKIAPKAARHVFSQKTIEALRETAHYHALPLGEVIAHFAPSAVLHTHHTSNSAPVPVEIEETAADALVLQAEREERLRMYRSLAREAFARGESLFILAPTIAEAEGLYSQLHRGIEEQVLIVTSASTKKTILTAWKRANEDPEPLLIIGTYSFLSLPRRHVGAIIVERESARSYVSREPHALDARIAAEHIARKNGARIIFADFPLRIHTRERLREGDLEELVRLQISSQSSARVHIIDARHKHDDATTLNTHTASRKKKFSVFTDTAREMIQRELARGARVFLYAPRRGLAPITICNDCGTPVTDPSTGAPMTLHKTEAGNMFLSYRSGAIMPANISCKKCGSWNLVSLGIGIERVVEETERLFNDTPVFVLSADSAPTHAKAKKIQNHFFNTPGAVLIGTERALPYLMEPIELSIVVSIDSLLSISAWRAHEYALATLFFLRDHTQDTLVIQTRITGSPVITSFASGNPTEFVREELKERETYRYPPFATFVGLSWSGTEKAVNTLAGIVKEAVQTFDVVGPLPARQIGKNRFLARAVVRLEPGMWPNQELLNVLKTLPRDVAIAIDPDEIV